MDAVKKYLQDFSAPKNSIEAQGEDNFGKFRSSKLYLIGKVLDHDVRIRELAGQLSIYVNNHLVREIDFSSPRTAES